MHKYAKKKKKKKQTNTTIINLSICNVLKLLTNVYFRGFFFFLMDAIALPLSRNLLSFIALRVIKANKQILF